MTARLCWTYLMLLILSFLAMDHVVWQRVLVSMWLGYAATGSLSNQLAADCLCGEPRRRRQC